MSPFFSSTTPGTGHRRALTVNSDVPAFAVTSVQSPLLALPFELRRLIYGFILKRPHSSNTIRLVIPLVRTCRQLRHEVSGMYYQNTVFVIQHPHQELVWLHKIPAELLQAFRYMEVHVTPRWQISMTSPLAAERGWQGLMALVTENMPNLLLTFRIQLHEVLDLADTPFGIALEEFDQHLRNRLLVDELPETCSRHTRDAERAHRQDGYHRKMAMYVGAYARLQRKYDGFGARSTLPNANHTEGAALSSSPARDSKSTERAEHHRTNDGPRFMIKTAECCAHVLVYRPGRTSLFGGLFPIRKRV